MALHRLNVRELREALSAWPDEAIVSTEGCDCYGEAIHVEALTTNDDGRVTEVLITRAPHGEETD